MALSVGMVGIALVVCVLAYGIALGGGDDFRSVLSTILASVAAISLGISIGTWLHPPVLTHRAASLLAAMLSVIGVLNLRWLSDLLRSLSEGNLSPVMGLCLASLIASGISVFLSGLLAQRRSAVA